MTHRGVRRVRKSATVWLEPLSTAESEAPLRLMFDRLVSAPQRGGVALVLCGSATLLIGLLALVGWMFAIPVLVQPTDAFPPMRPLAGVAFALAGAATLASNRENRRRPQLLGYAMLAVVGLGTLRALTGFAMPFQPFLSSQAARMGVSPVDGLALSVVISLSVFAVAILLIHRTDVTRGEMLAAYALGILLATGAGILAIVHVSTVQLSPRAEFVGAGLQPLLATAILGVALILMVSRTRAVPTSPPRWVPAFTGLTMAALVIVLWQVLRADDALDDARRADLAAEAFARSVETQLDHVKGALLRRATFAEQFSPTSEIGRQGIELLIKDIDGLEQVL